MRAVPDSAHRSRQRFGRKKNRSELTLGELEALAGALLPVLLSFFCACIACQQSERFQLSTQFRVEFNQGTSDTHTGCSCLTTDTTAIGEDQNIEPVRHLRREERLSHVGTSGLANKIILKRPMIYRNLALTRPQENACSCRLPTAGSQLLN